MAKVNIGIIQQSRVDNDKERNIKQTIQEIEKLVKQGAQIVCLQELFATLYFCDEENPNNFELSETLDGYTVRIMQDIAKKLGVVIIVSLFEKRTHGLYHNTVVVFDDKGTNLGYYRKLHIPDDPGFFEKYYFTPGDAGYKVFETKYGKIGVLICWDQWFPEAARAVTLMGAEIIFYPTAIGWELSTNDEINNQQYDAWQTIQRAHAIANGVHVVAVNRVGVESQTKFWGGSFVADPFGKIIYQSPFDKEDIKVISIDTDLTKYYRTIWPFLRDRRVDTYSHLLKKFID